MNRLDFYLALLGGCKRDVARVAGKVGGLTDCVFTGLCEALPETKCRAGGLMGRNGGYHRKGVCVSIIIIIALILCSCGNKKIFVNPFGEKVIDAFALIDNGFSRTNFYLIAGNQTALDEILSLVAWHDTTTSVLNFYHLAVETNARAQFLIYSIHALKIDLIRLVDSNDAPSLTPVAWLIGYSISMEMLQTYDIEPMKIRSKAEIGKTTDFLRSKSRALELKEKIEAYRIFLMSIVEDPHLLLDLEDLLNTDDIVKQSDFSMDTWETYNFENMPLIAVIANLSRLQNDILNAEAQVIKYLKYQILYPPPPPLLRGITIDVEEGEFSDIFEILPPSDDIEDEAILYALVDVKPLFNGKAADIGFREYVYNNLRYPTYHFNNTRVIIEFVIETDGSISNANIVHVFGGDEPQLNAEALRVINSSPRWTPGIYNGKAVRVIYRFPVFFRLQ